MQAKPARRIDGRSAKSRVAADEMSDPSHLQSLYDLVLVIPVLNEVAETLWPARIAGNQINKRRVLRIVLKHGLRST
jgi:hypothetical protein